MATITGIKVEMKRRMMDMNGLTVPEGALLQTEPTDVNFNSGFFRLAGEIEVNESKEKVDLWAYRDDFVLVGTY